MKNNKNTEVFKVNCFDATYELKAALELYTVTDFAGNEKNGLAILLYDATTYEPFGTLTVSFGEFISIINAAYIDNNSMPQTVIDEICGKHAKRTPLCKHGNFGTEYPLYVFDAEWLKSIGKENYDIYLKSFDNSCED